MKYRLSDICEYAKGKIKVSALDENTYISTENMLPNKGGITKAASLPTQEQTQAFMKNDVLVSNIRPYFKKIWYATFDGGCSNDVLVFRAKDGVSSRFLHYVLADENFFDYSMATSKGTKMPRGDKKAIMEYEVPELSYEEQCKIAGILEVIDDKIELNNKINDNLSKQITAIFDDFYSSVSDNEYKHCSLGEVCKCVLGGTPSRANKSFWGGNIPWINSGEVNEFRVVRPSEYITEEGLSHSATKLLPAGTTLIAITGATLGRFSLLEIDSCANQSVVGIIPNKSMPREYVYELIKKNIFKLISHQTGGAQQHINLQDVKGLDVLIPANEEMEQYSSLVKPMFGKIASNCFENDRLAKLRDSILPRLLNGDFNLEI